MDKEKKPLVFNLDEIPEKIMWYENNICFYTKSGKLCFLIIKTNEKISEIKEVSQGIPAENIAGNYTLADMASVLQYSQLVVSVNTGIMHYAAAVGVPLVAIHGATSEVRWGPLSNNSVVVKSSPACQPCISLGFESNCTKPICMENVTVNMVMAVRSLNLMA